MTTLPWHVAARRAGQLAPAGPSGTRPALRGVVRSLRESARTAPELVAGITGLHEAASVASAFPVYVVDRPGWSAANAEVFASFAGESLGLENRFEARMAAEETAVMLALLSTRVLGQFDPYLGEPRLLLVAPNIVKLERDLDLDAMDFRLWVSLHEQTHAVQFAAAPWLAAHLRGRISAITEGISAIELGPNRVKAAVSALLDLIRGKKDAVSLLSSILTPDESRELEGIIAVMSLLEGHADVVMDEVGPARIPSVRRIRASFERRRDGVGVMDLLVRRLTGMNEKIAQYRDGAAFVRGVVARAGHPGLNAVWASPENLPTAEEIARPELWVRRVRP